MTTTEKQKEDAAAEEAQKIIDSIFTLREASNALEYEGEMRSREIYTPPAIPAEKQKQLDDLYEEFNPKITEANRKLTEATKQLKKKVLLAKRTIKGENQMAVYSEKVFWDKKALEIYAADIPKLAKHKEIRASVAIRVVK